MSAETPIMREILLALSSAGARAFRNNVGVAKFFDKHGEERRVRYGLCTGSSDIIGLVPVKITSDMVGKTVAVFTAIEVKDAGRQTEEQRRFIAMVKDRGGIAGVARSVSDALALVRRPPG